MSETAAHIGPWQRLQGRTFVHPLFDYLLIGGGLSLIASAVIFATPGRRFVPVELLPVFILFSNSAHFAASTVRLYTKPESFKSMPFLTMMFPLVMLALLTLCIRWANTCGPHLQSLYLTWSPYHYAAQAYGLAVMYSYRSKRSLDDRERRLLKWTCLLPFLFAFVYNRGGGLHWILQSVLSEQGMDYFAWSAPLYAWRMTVAWIGFLLPLLLFVKLARGSEGAIPAISMLVIITNGVWWYFLPTVDAFAWATVYHGVQYLAIVIIFHLKDQMARPENRRGRAYHVVWFYGASLLLGYGLFQCLPGAYQFFGFGDLESILLVAAAINLHHFIVDGYIWRLRKSDTNRQIVESGAPAVPSTI